MNFVFDVSFFEEGGEHIDDTAFVVPHAGLDDPDLSEEVAWESALDTAEDLMINYDAHHFELSLRN